MSLNDIFKPDPDKSPPQTGGARERGMELRFAAVFLLLFFTLQYGYSASRGSTIEHLVIDVATVRPSAAVINLVAPDAGARASGHRIVSPRGSLSVLNGCEGTETLFLLLAAIIAYKASWRHKLEGAALGLLIVYALNQGRIVALFFAAQQNRKWFDLLHGIIAPTFIIVLGCLFFLWWAGRSAARENGQAGAA